MKFRAYILVRNALADVFHIGFHQFVRISIVSGRFGEPQNRTTYTTVLPSGHFQYAVQHHLLHELFSQWLQQLVWLFHSRPPSHKDDGYILIVRNADNY